MSTTLAAHEHVEAERERLLLEAFMGYKLDFVRGQVVIRVCAHCPGKPYVEAWAQSRGNPVTHSICPTHAAEMIARITGDKTHEPQSTERRSA